MCEICTLSIARNYLGMEYGLGFPHCCFGKAPVSESRFRSHYHDLLRHSYYYLSLYPLSIKDDVMYIPLDGALPALF